MDTAAASPITPQLKPKPKKSNWFQKYKRFAPILAIIPIILFGGSMYIFSSTKAEAARLKKELPVMVEKAQKQYENKQFDESIKTNNTIINEIGTLTMFLAGDDELTGIITKAKQTIDAAKQSKEQTVAEQQRQKEEELTRLGKIMENEERAKALLVNSEESAKKTVVDYIEACRTSDEKTIAKLSIMDKYYFIESGEVLSCRDYSCNAEDFISFSKATKWIESNLLFFPHGTDAVFGKVRNKLSLETTKAFNKYKLFTSKRDEWQAIKKDKEKEYTKLLEEIIISILAYDKKCREICSKHRTSYFAGHGRIETDTIAVFKQSMELAEKLGEQDKEIQKLLINHDLLTMDMSASFKMADYDLDENAFLNFYVSNKMLFSGIDSLKDKDDLNILNALMNTMQSMESIVVVCNLSVQGKGTLRYKVKLARLITKNNSIHGWLITSIEQMGK